ncbi:MAG TPA: MarR family transcriptional regulator [Gammaproteobacteria bacterium]|jgi:predicted transcriptional regulator|nr:MarR family transcriptional regulator [Gammaproteobacteria bacterium]
MPRLRKSKEIIFTVKTEAIDKFFERGKNTAKLLDAGKQILPRRVISFEDPKDLIKFLTEAKLILLAAIRKKPDSISGLAHRLHRSRSAIDKDVQLLESIKIVESEYVINPGHGRCRIIKTIDSRPIKLQVEATI